MNNNHSKYFTSDFLVKKFNEREKSAFSYVYVEIFDDINRFADRLFENTEIASEDLLQDIFLNIWINKQIKFENTLHIKNYIYQSIKNRYKDYLKHKLRSINFAEKVNQLEDWQFSQMVETEVFSILSVAQNVLTTECAKTLKLYIEGYDIKEIAEKLGKSQYTIYHQKDEAIKVLKKHLSGRKITFLLNFLSIV